MADNTETNDTNEKKGMNFVEQIVYDDLQAGKNDGRLNTRFPPEPNGYLHIGHAKAICMDFGIAEKFGGTCNLRFDDTNPVKEDVEYVDSIREDIHWLGFDWATVSIMLRTTFRSCMPWQSALYVRAKHMSMTKAARK